MVSPSDWKRGLMYTFENTCVQEGNRDRIVISEREKKHYED